MFELTSGNFMKSIVLIYLLGFLKSPTAIISYLLSKAGMYACFEKLGIKGWKALIPIYCEYLTFEKVWEKKKFKQLIILGIVSIVSFGIAIYVIGTPMKTNSTLDIGMLPLTLYLIGGLTVIGACLIEIGKSIEFAHAFNLSGASVILYVLFSPIYNLILGFGKATAGNNQEEVVDTNKTTPKVERRKNFKSNKGKNKEREKKQKKPSPKTYKALNKEIKAINGNYDSKTHLLLGLGVIIAMIIIGFIFRLSILCGAILCIIGLISYPAIVMSVFKKKNSDLRFANLTSYMENMIINFKKTPKIIVALKTTRDFCEGVMLEKVDEAIYTIENDTSTPDIYRKALGIIEDEFMNSRLKSLHKFMITVEQNNSVNFQEGIDNLYYDIHNWVTRVLGFQKSLKDRKSKIILSIGAAFGIVAYFTSVLFDLETSFENVSLSGSLLYQIATVVFIIIMLIMYRITEMKFGEVNLVDDLSGYNEQKILKKLDTLENFNQTKEITNALMLSVLVGGGLIALSLILKSDFVKYVGILMAALFIIVGLTSKRLTTNSVENELLKEFPAWLRDVSVNLQNMVVVQAVETTSMDTSPLMKVFSKRFINAVKEDPVTMGPYNNFFGIFDMPQLITSIKTLYSLQSTAKEDTMRQLNDLVTRNQELISQSEEIRLNDTIAGVSFLTYIPMLVMSFKLMVDMVVMMMGFMSAF